MMKLLRLPPRDPRPASKKRGRGHQWDPRLLVPPINPPFPAASRSYRLKKYLLYGFRSSPIELSTIGAPTPVGRERPCGEQARQPWNCSKQCSTRWPWDYSEEERATVLGSSVHQRATPSSTSERGREGDDAAPPRRTRAAGPPAPGTPSPHGAGPGPPRCPCAPPVSFPLHPSHSRHSTRQTATYGNKMERDYAWKGGRSGRHPFSTGPPLEAATVALRRPFCGCGLQCEHPLETTGQAATYQPVVHDTKRSTETIYYLYFFIYYQLVLK
jgi:hypothetical protein